MRVADASAFRQTRENMSKNRSEMNDLQNQAASQKRVTKPSDDPVAAARVLTQRVDLQGQDQYLKNLNYAKSFLNYSDQSLGDLSELLIRAKELALGQASDAGSNENSRRVVGTEVSQIYDQMVLIGNRRLGDRYIFGGYKTTEPPFNSKGGYSGDSGEMLVHVDKDSFVAMNLPGSKVFIGEGLSSDSISHVTSIQPTTAKDLAEELNKKPEGDVNNMASPEEDQVRVRGPASVSPDEKERFSVPVGEEEGGRNIFEVVKDLQISLVTNDKSGVQEALEELDNSIEQVVLARAQVGSRVNSLNHSMETLGKAKVDTADSISQLEDADLLKVVSDMSKTESSLQATLQSSGKILQRSLMDFLR